MSGTTEQHLTTVRRRLDGRDGHGLRITSAEGEHQAVLYALLALVSEQQATNIQLARIADALQQPKAVAPAEPEPKRRLWLPSRRTT